ncbi:MAG: pilus assembly protein PilP [Gammaproteobacteria bacterium]|nr:pilus assembly protein PilP [Gammaproteobacteria bacterium]
MRVETLLIGVLIITPAVGADNSWVADIENTTGSATSESTSNRSSQAETRDKEYLEQFHLTKLSLNSLDVNGEWYAQIRDPEGATHDVRVGQFLGKHFGKVEKIDAEAVYVAEVRRGRNETWFLREVRIPLSRQPLEEFDLYRLNLKKVGKDEKGQAFAEIIDPKGRHHIVRKGDFLGIEHAEIFVIEPEGISSGGGYLPKCPLSNEIMKRSLQIMDAFLRSRDDVDWREKAYKLLGWQWPVIWENAMLEAANQGWIQPNFVLGLLHSNGHLVSDDPNLAAQYYKVGAEKGYLPATVKLADLILNEHIHSVERQEAAKWLYEVGMLYKKGHRVAKNQHRARRYLEAARERGTWMHLNELQEMAPE